VCPEKWARSQYFNQLLLEMNVYQTSTTLNGSVWQYELPQFNNYNFSAPISSTRLMFDFKPNLFSWRKFSAYAILGVGAVPSFSLQNQSLLFGVSLKTINHNKGYVL